MAVYVITGKLGSGKGKGGIQRLREYMRQGKRVATNCDLFMEHLDHNRSRATVIRIPDKPTTTDLYMIGSGNQYVTFETNIVQTSEGIKGMPPKASPAMLPGFDESHNGALVLDELGSWLNTRNFQDKGRAELLEWFIHARKYGWDIFFICQNVSQIDKQIRDSLFEYVVRMNRLDRMRVPFLSGMVKTMSAGALTGNMPRVHIGVVRMGSSADGLVADRWIFRGDDLNNAYNTTQVFSDSYPHGIHTLLSPWHLSASIKIPPNFVGPLRLGCEDYIFTPRTAPLKPPHPHMTKFLAMSLLLGAVLGAAGYAFFAPALVPANSISAATPNTVKPSETITGRGYMNRGGIVSVILSDGSIIESPPGFTSDANGNWQAHIRPDLLVKGGTK